MNKRKKLQRRPSSAGDRSTHAGGRILTGSFILNPKGFGFVRPDAAKLPDIFIPPHATCGALTLDYVEIQAHFYGRNKASGAVQKILKRRSQKLVGQVLADKGRLFLSEKKSSKLFPLDVPAKVKLEPDSIVIAERVARKLGETAVYERRIDPANFSDCQEAILAEFGLAAGFPKELVRHVDAIPFSDRPDERDSLGLSVRDRVDLRGKAFVTIDGASAKDFDDAVVAEKTKDGAYRLYVSIADVSAFLPEDSLCDIEAYERGTSTYFPSFALPMLPERLSNDLCSLVPHRPRWTFTAELTLDRAGTVTASALYPSIIRSKARLTYEGVQAFLDSGVGVEDKEVAKSLHLLSDIAKALMHKRQGRGSLDFDLPEAVFVLDKNQGVAGVTSSTRLFAHRLIEECMIAANEAVAEFMDRHGLPGIWRIHDGPDPENLEHFLTSLKLYSQGLSPSDISIVGACVAPSSRSEFGWSLPLSRPVAAISKDKDSDRRKKSKPSPPERVDLPVAPKTLQSWVNAFKGKDYEPFLLKLLLRSLKQAHYQEENLGHFGLASKSYTHFTSPIRRYPDLYIHRLLRRFLLTGARVAPSRPGKARSGASPSRGLRPLISDDAHAPERVASYASYRERISMEAEREMNKLWSARFMQDKLGREFDGIVSHTTPHGLYVLLKEHFVEGFVPKENLGTDATYDDKALAWVMKGQQSRYGLGKNMRVQIIKVDLYERSVIARLISK